MEKKKASSQTQSIKSLSGLSDLTDIDRENIDVYNNFPLINLYFLKMPIKKFISLKVFEETPSKRPGD